MIETVSQGHNLKSHTGALIASKTLFVQWLLVESGVKEKADSQQDGESKKESSYKNEHYVVCEKSNKPADNEK